MVIASTNPPNLPDATKTRFTPDEYRAIEETAEERHEYFNGEIIAMPVGSEVHSAIACNLLIYLGLLLRDTEDRELCVEGLIEIVLNINAYMGVNRLFIP
ncbi:Uma2 family endonuclease [Microcoleus sp. w1-18aA5]|uniref:Uma2 family endonuclease n=1 Tax=unclassified Microcoleus TaxID=2642155 RepID=UPI002FD65338